MLVWSKTNTDTGKAVRVFHFVKSSTESEESHSLSSETAMLVWSGDELESQVEPVPLACLVKQQNRDFENCINSSCEPKRHRGTVMVHMPLVLLYG